MRTEPSSRSSGLVGCWEMAVEGKRLKRVARMERWALG